MSKFATVTLKVQVDLERHSVVSNPIVGTELPYEYLAVRDVEATAVEVHGNRNAIALLDWDDEAIDPDGFLAEEVRQALSDELPTGPDGYRVFLEVSNE